MDVCIRDLHELERGLITAKNFAGDSSDVAHRGARRLEECRAFFERFAAGEPPPENTTYEQWARELLA